jgi:5'-3' exonuclease
MQDGCRAAVHHLHKLSGCEWVMLHTTPSLSDKGGRYEHAIQKEYQGNRKDKAKPRFLSQMRDFITSKEFNGYQHMNCEADDGMSAAQYMALSKGESSMIISMDKDLNMVPGLHLGWKTGEINEHDKWGRTYLDEKGKLRGEGWKFFWAQMLTGDTADNTQGLPGLLPTMASKFTGRGHKTLVKVGPTTGQSILDKIHSNAQAMNLIKGLYEVYGDTYGYKHWKTGEDVSWQKVFISEAKLHWMRRDLANPDDVIMWMAQECK